jgi:hypothetical protein
MNTPPREIRDAFRTLERRLAARRFAALNGRMRVLILLLFGYIVAFVYWQARVPLDGLRRAKGEPAAALALGGVLASIALLGAITAAWRRTTFTERVPGPEWLALPVPPEAVGRHLAAESALFAAAAAPAALAALAAGIGLVSPLHLGAIVIAWALLALASAGLAARLAARATRPASGGTRTLAPALRDLLVANRRAAARPHPAPRWRAEPAWRALARLDGLSAWRRSAARTRLLLAASWFAAGGAAWFAPAPPLTQRALAFAAFAGGAATLGAWAIARTCADPPSALRPLPLRVADPWRARAARVTLVLAAVSVLDALLAWSLPPMARVGVVLTFLPSGVAIALLGVNYGITLAPRRLIAENLYYGWLGVALIASWMIPFLGWGVMVAGLVHSGLRLSRAPRMETT